MTGLQDIINVAKCTADVQKEQQNCCVSFVKSERETRWEFFSFNFLLRKMGFKNKKYSEFPSTTPEKQLGSTFL
jgi:hypothetical protein